MPRFSYFVYYLVSVLLNLPRNIFNFSAKYHDNTLPTRKISVSRHFPQSSNFSFCFQSETLEHVVSSCKSYISMTVDTLGDITVLIFLFSRNHILIT